MFVDVEAGRKIALSCHGNRENQVLICAPGLGDVKESYRLLTASLQKSFFVVRMDLRGHGDSDAFASYAPEDVGNDIIKVIESISLNPGEQFVLVGCSFSAASCVWAAAQQPNRIAGMIFIGPFVRDTKMSFFTKAMLRLAFVGLWGRASWTKYFQSLFPSNKPNDFDEYVTHLRSTLDRDGHFEAVRAMIFASKAECEKRLPEVRQAKIPALVLMGSEDPDFADPEQEARWIGAQLSETTVKIIPAAGHYPHHERPKETSDEVLRFLNRIVL